MLSFINITQDKAQMVRKKYTGFLHFEGDSTGN